MNKVEASKALSAGLLGICLLGCRGEELSLGNNDAGFGAPGALFVDAVFSPQSVEKGRCSYSPGPGSLFESTGFVDVSFASLSTYTPTLLVGNQGGEPLLVRGAATHITDLAGNASLVAILSAMCAEGDEAACATGRMLCSRPSESCPGSSSPADVFSTVESGEVPIAGASPSYSAIAVTIVDANTMTIMRKYFDNLLIISAAAAFGTTIQLVTYTQVLATSPDGSTVSSNMFEFPVTFGYGGLVSNLSTDASGYCISQSSATTITTCIAGQDTPEDVTSLTGVPACTSGDAGVLPAADGGAH